MASTNPKRFILQAIEHLRGRKARPDLHRICNMLKKRHSFNFADTTRCIENLMDMGIIIKVEYKGSISYRDAARWKKGHVAGQIINSDVLVSKIQGAIDAIESRAGPADGNHSIGGGDSASAEEIGGATKEEIEQYLKSLPGEANCQLAGDAMFEALIREVERQTLRKICDRYFVGKRVIPSPQPRRSRSPVKLPESSPKAKRVVSASPSADKEDSSSDAGSVKRRGRPPSKRKRFKKNHGDDFEVIPIGKPRKAALSETQDMEVSEKKELDYPPELTPESSLHEKFRRCNDDHLTEVPSRHEGQEQDLLVCTVCHIKAHPYCVGYSEERLERIDRNTWRCVACKQCCVCNSFVKAAIPVICSGCDKAYHRSCHQPILKKRPKDGWKCSECMTDAHLMGLTNRQQLDHDDLSLHESLQSSVQPAESAENRTSFPPTPCDSPSPDNVDKLSPEMPVLEPILPRQESKEERRLMVSKFDGQSFPDVTHWSVEKVVEFVESAGFLDQAQALKAEEIDGEALMDLKRNDVLTRFSLKLGPALKLYRLILNMQTNGNAADFI